MADQEDRDWQRLDKWLWCARFMRARADCARLVAAGSIRINRQTTEKPHARLRVGDVLTVPVRDDVRVVRVAALADGEFGPPCPPLMTPQRRRPSISIASAAPAPAPVREGPFAELAELRRSLP